VPRCIGGRRFAKHTVSSFFVGLPFLSIAEIFKTQFPTFHWIEHPHSKAAELFLRRNMQEDLYDTSTVIGEHTLKLIDLLVGPPPVAITCQSFDAFNENAPVPRSVKHGDRTARRQALEEAGEVMPIQEILSRRREWADAESARIKHRRNTTDCPTLARSIPALKYNRCGISRLEIGVLYQPELLLDPSELTMIDIVVQLSSRVLVSPIERGRARAREPSVRCARRAHGRHRAR